jgi:AraC-like DNA-binding protein
VQFFLRKSNKLCNFAPKSGQMMYPLRKNTPLFIRKWGNWLLVVVLLMVKSYLFDIAVTRPASVSWVLYDWLANAAAALIVALPVLLTRRKYPVFVILGVTDVWLTANIIYYRSYRLFITWHLLKLTSNMDGFWNSIVPYLSVSLLVFPALTVLAAVCLLWESQRARWYEVCAVLVAGVLLSIGGSYSRWERKREQGCQAPFTVEWVNPCILPQDLSAHISENEQQPRIYIREHISEPLSLKMVGDAIHISSGYLSRIFSTLAAQTFCDYINEEKIAFSRKLLSQTSLSIDEIAERCGFNTPNYFATVFKKYMGQSPVAYRNSLLKTD